VINSATGILVMELKENNKNWFNDICENAIIERNALRKKALQNPSDENIIKYEEQKKLTNKTLEEKNAYTKRRNKNEYIDTTQRNFSN